MESDIDLKDVIDEFLAGSKLMQLATISEEGPWVCSVYFSNDEEGKLYWISRKDRRHSKEILKNSKTACTIVYNEKGKQALQITGKSKMVELNDSERVDKLHGDKFGHKSARLEEVLENTAGGRAYWVLDPETIYLWDEINFPNSPKQKYL